MKLETKTIIETIYRSEVIPEIASRDQRDAEVIVWADAYPHVYHIITHNKSKAFGKNSCHYIGYAQGNNSPHAILQRLREFYEEVYATDYRANQIWGWRANFTFKHYGDKGFRGGFFQQWDEKYPRGCLSLDYTPETLEGVIDKFVDWCGSSYNTKKITIDNRVARQY